MEDLYSILGVTKTASKEEIKKAYRKLAMQHHPDRNSGDKQAEEKFKEINMAYEILSDDSKRRQYDMFGSTSGASNPFSGAGFGGVDVDLGDIFNSFFGEGFSTRNKRKTETPGEDLQYNLNIDLKTSIFGGKEKIAFNRKEECHTCHGEGGKGKKTCPKCNGTGQLLHTTQSIFGVIQQTVACDECVGSGEIFGEICSECHGEKRVVTKKELEIDIPAGIDSGMVIKLTGEGNAGVGTKAKGSLYVKFEVPSEEKGLVREGYDLHYKVEIEVVEAVLGVKKELNIPIIGKRKIEIKPGTQNGNIVKISNDGVKHIDGDKKGDLYLEIFVKIPKKLSKNERKFYEELAEEGGMKVDNKGVFENLFNL